jgi:hypothetical protein
MLSDIQNLEKINRVQIEGVVNLTKPQFTFLLQKAKISQITIYCYLDFYDSSSLIVHQCLESLNLTKTTTFITRDEYKHKMEAHQMSEKNILHNLEDYDKDPEFAQLWISLSYKKEKCCIM